MNGSAPGLPFPTKPGHIALWSLGKLFLTGALVDGAKSIRLWGETIRVAASVHTVGGLSAHADQAGLTAAAGVITCAGLKDSSGTATYVPFMGASKDLTYGFGLFRQDNSMVFQMQVLPGHVNDLLWQFDRAGVYTIRSTEYSGPAGVAMISPVSPSQVSWPEQPMVNGGPTGSRVT